MKMKAMSTEKANAMKARMVEAKWDEVDEIVEACADCEDGADVADVLVHRIAVQLDAGFSGGWLKAWKLVKEWADGDFAEPAPF